MLKQRLKWVFPDTLIGSIVASLKCKDNDFGSISDSTLDSGEELETFQPNVFGSDDRDAKDDDVALAHSSLILRSRPDPTRMSQVLFRLWMLSWLTRDYLILSLSFPESKLI